MRHDLIDAVFSLGGQDDLALIVKRVEALSKFLETDDGANLRAGVKRASNILAIEEKKDGTSFEGAPDAKLLDQPEEKALAAAIAKTQKDAAGAIAVENFSGAMSALADLRQARRRLLRQGHGQRARRQSARQPPEAARPDPRRHASRRRFLQDRGVGKPVNASPAKPAEQARAGASTLEA